MIFNLNIWVASPGVATLPTEGWRRIDLGGLDLEGLVDEVPKHLLPKLVHLIGRNGLPIRDRKEGEALIDVGLRNDVAVHDRRRLDDGPGRTRPPCRPRS